MGLQANPNGNFGVTTEGYCVYVGDPTNGNFGDLKLFGVLAGTGLTGQFRTPASAGGLVIVDFPGTTANLRWWLGSGLATPNGFMLGTSAAHKLGFWGKAPIVQPAAIAAPSGGTTIDTQARAAIQSIINTLSAAAGGNGLTA